MDITPTKRSNASPDVLDALFSPFRHKGMSLANRIVMSPMTRYFSPDGIPGKGVADYYAARARGGTGLIISEGAFIDRAAARNVAQAPSFHGPALDEWASILAAVHRDGAAMAPQLWHTGGLVDFNFPDDPHAAKLESPSGLRGPDLVSGSTMSEADITDVVTSFARAAADAARLGFDALELHGAHGYLFDQFFWHATNARADRFGGVALADRTAFACDVIAAIRAAVPADFVLIFRLSQWKTYFYDTRLAETPGDLEAWLSPLADAGVDIFDCSQRRFWQPEFAGSDLNLAGWAKKVTGKPTITVGSVGLDTDLFTDFETGAVSKPAPKSIEAVAERLDRGEFDLVAVGRAILADADWPNKVRQRNFSDLIGYSVDRMKTL